MTLNLCLTEQQVDTLATGLIHLLKENPRLLGLYHTESVDDIIDFTAEDVT
jgi:hypothetical protein